MLKHSMYICVILCLYTNCAPVSLSNLQDAGLAKDSVAEADDYLLIQPTPITSFTCERSAGSAHDFYSEGDYWWPNPDDPSGPYIRKDGQTNPENFVAHRQAMRNLSRWVAALTAAYKATKEARYADHAMMHLEAWFVNPATRMNPSLLFAQAISGKVTGRGIGIIDTIHLIEVAKSIQLLKQSGILSDTRFEALRKWFDDYVTWMTTHPYGVAERDHGNNHSTWWVAQVAAFASLAGREDLLQLSRSKYKQLLNEQMDSKGGFPDELERTKPFNYSLFNVEGYAVIAHIASTANDNLWTYESKSGTVQKAIEFLLPAIQDKTAWSYPPDVQHFDEIPIQSATLLFAAIAYDRPDYYKIWRSLDKDRKSQEVDRNFPLRSLEIWL